MENTEFIIESGVLAKYGGSGGDVTIPEGVTEIGPSAFEAHRGLKSVAIPDGVARIGTCAFSHCPGLASVAIPASVAEIGQAAFFGCRGLKDVAVPEGVARIGDCAFMDCSGLTSVAIPGSVKRIRRETFRDCTGLVRVEIMEGVKAIGEEAFLGCDGLVGVVIPASVVEIGGHAFKDCVSLERVAYDGTRDQWRNIWVEDGNHALLRTTKHFADDTAGNAGTPTKDEGFTIRDGLLIDYKGPDGDISIPASVTEIGNYAFAGRAGLTSVAIPDGVTEIGEGAFTDCACLKSVAIPASVEVVCKSAFMNCAGLKDVHYGGTPEQWSGIKIGEQNRYLLAAARHHIGERAHAGGAAGMDIRVIDGVRYARLDDMGVLGKLVERYARTRQD